jgi:hypothetical protein
MARMAQYARRKDALMNVNHLAGTLRVINEIAQEDKAIRGNTFKKRRFSHEKSRNGK